MNTPERILLIDDDRMITSVFARVLTGAGYEVRAVNLAAEGLSAAIDFKPSLILLDARLPDGDGREVLASIRRAPEVATTRVAILSGFPVSLDDLDELTWYFAKPVRLAALIDSVRYMLASTSRRGAQEAVPA